MSFGVVGIAIDRLRTVYSLMQIEKTTRVCIQNGGDQLMFVRVIFLFYFNLKYLKNFYF